MRLASSAVLLVLTICISAAEAAAQGADVPRPRLAAAIDTNSWEAYYDFGIANLKRDRRAAEAAFIWASRLDPGKAEPLFARWITYWARDPEKFARLVREDETLLRDPTVLAADSIREIALRRNPFVHQGLILHLFDQLPGRFRDDVATRGWIALARGQLPQAIAAFGTAMKRDQRRHGHLRFPRASAFVNLAQYDSAVTEIDLLIAQLRQEDEAAFAQRYESKELLEYASGLLQMQLRNTGAARQAFGRALVENAGFTPAKAMLGQLALSSRDTATALFEYSTAVDVDPADALLRLGYGRALLAARRPADAAAQLQTAVDLEPYYAEPYYLLGQALEQSTQPYPARLAYQRFLSLAPRGDSRRPQAERKVESLSMIGRD
jgi:Flp pilus assembly protein TadD